MKISEEELGILTNLAEECAEVQQMVSKIIRFGWDSYHPQDTNKTPNIVRLANEVGNLLAMLDIINLPEDEISIGVRMKKDGLLKYGLMEGDKKYYILVASQEELDGIENEPEQETLKALSKYGEICIDEKTKSPYIIHGRIRYDIEPVIEQVIDE